MPEQILFKIEVKESKRTRSYWEDEARFPSLREGLRSADILILPWEDFRDGHDFLYPQGTSELYKSLLSAVDAKVILVAVEEEYREIALHSRSWRLPTILVDKVFLPAVAGVLAMAIYGAFETIGEDDSIEISLLVEGDNGRCVELSYQGPPSRSIESILSEVESCFPELAPLPKPDNSSIEKKGNGKRKGLV